MNKGTLNENGEHEIDESSGLAYSRNIPGHLWAFNNSGGKARIFAISEEGRRLRSVKLRGAKNRDWEDMAVVAKEGGTSYIYVGDIGDNPRKREYLTIFKFPEPTTLGGSSFSINEDEIEKIKVKYPGRKYDCEALVVDPDIYVGHHSPCKEGKRLSSLCSSPDQWTLQQHQANGGNRKNETCRLGDRRRHIPRWQNHGCRLLWWQSQSEVRSHRCSTSQVIRPGDSILPRTRRHARNSILLERIREKLLRYQYGCLYNQRMQ